MTAADEIKKASEGHLKSIEQICSSMWEPLYRFIYYRVQNREEAEDITQETFVRFLANWQEQPAARGNLPAFLKTISLNLMRDRWRQKQRRGKEIDILKIDPAEIAAIDEQKIIIDRMQVENALTQLSPEQREILNLRIIKGHSVAETANLMGKTEAAVRTAQYRALKVLAQIIAEESLV
jgi:RNA polymerase sigma-70 factor (ECF subfamily)